MTTWHFTREGERRGPVSDDELRGLVVAGTVKPWDLAWRSGMDAWTRIEELPELAPEKAPPSEPPAMPTIPPPLPSAKRRESAGAAAPSPASPAVQATAAEKPIWSPRALRFLGFVFTPALGSILVHLDHRALSLPHSLLRTALWITASFTMAAALLVSLGDGLSSIRMDSWVLAYGLLYLLWYFVDVRPLQRHLQDSGRSPPNRRWIVPASIGGAVLGVYAAILLVLVLYNRPIDVVRTGSFQRTPGVTVGALFDIFLNEPDWDVDYGGSACAVTAKGRLGFEDPRPPTVCVFQVDLEREAFEISEFKVNDVRQSPRDVQALIDAMYKQLQR